VLTVRALALTTVALFTIVFAGAAESAQKSRKAIREHEAGPTKEQLQLQISMILEDIKALKIELAARSSIDTDLRYDYIAWQKRKFEYAGKIYDVNIDAFNVQRWHTSVLLAIVFLITSSGVAFAGYQLAKSAQINTVGLPSELEISARKIKLETSVVGIVILLISFGFLYLYIKHAYEIKYAETPKLPDMEVNNSAKQMSKTNFME
jgi:hypothetical protein